ncbi:inner membrane protein [Caldalkalibacillus uzonensis]|uniref:Inner membrane protein n=1 Tax=Caldalkalibacillus uzonensis TaxID=353224 RepID=A0ABU0CTI4_9BACI|nr:metal-dependent hydrolase [Caldalkalibacillus uzonensis]MDQ0339728.1 inner membrane protein [Caldalkalibacillus uzonensis]
MDTASHFLIGAGLGGLAHLHPEVASTPSVGLAVTIGTVIASQAPDFDCVCRLKGDAAYFKYHRGISHSIPFWFIWPTLITLLIIPFVDGLSWSLLWMWCFIAVLVHVGLDVLNTYGTQALRPFTEEWLAKDVLMILDPYIFLTQLAGIILWWTGNISPGPLFAGLNGLTLLYVLIRIYLHRFQLGRISSLYRKYKPVSISVTPTFRFNNWQVIVETEDRYILGRLRNGEYREEIKLPKSWQQAWQRWRQKSDVLDAFLYFAKYVYFEKRREGDILRLKWTDLRFRFGQSFPFQAVMEVDYNGNIVKETIGWGHETNEKVNMVKVLKEVVK